MCIRDSPSPRSASGAPAAQFLRKVWQLREKRRRIYPSGASGTSFYFVSGPAQIQVGTPEATLACSINAGAIRFDRYDVQL
eukprot:14635222-Alexandrium_andersonii.AAC.1